MTQSLATGLTLICGNYVSIYCVYFVLCFTFFLDKKLDKISGWAADLQPELPVNTLIKLTGLSPGREEDDWTLSDRLEKDGVGDVPNILFETCFILCGDSDFSPRPIFWIYNGAIVFFFFFKLNGCK